ncbi:SpoIIE family protein phosphatase [bacterium]|nr:SpoIIE family protein phosphatase [bacterium]
MTRSEMSPCIPVIDGFEFFVAVCPFCEVAGGFYQFTLVNEDKLAIGICDFVGSMHPHFDSFISKLSSEMKDAILTIHDPAHILEHLDAVFTPILRHPDPLAFRMVMVSLAILDIRDGSMILTKGGQPDMVIRRADGSLEFPDRDIKGRLIGLVDGKELSKAEFYFENRTVQLNPGDVAIYCNEGLIEAKDIHNKSFVGCDDLRTFGEVVARNDGGPKAIGDAVMKRLREFTAGALQDDDMTFICFGPRPDFRPATT